KDFLGRNQVPYQWLDVEVSEEARTVAEAAGQGTGLPLGVLPDGGGMQAPSVAGGAARSGLGGKGERPLLAPGGRGRGRGRGRGSVRGLGRAAHLADRGRSTRGAGGHELAHRELPGISLRAVRR